MSTYGVTPQGFLRKTIENIIAEMEADELAEIAPDLDVSTDQIVGQLNGVFARQLGIAWEQLEIIYSAFDTDAAEGRLLDMLGKLTGTFRNGSTASTVVQNCDMDTGVVLQSGVHYVSVEDHPEIRWTPVSDYTAATTGLQPVTFKCDTLGPIQGFAGTINVIATAVANWRSTVNPNDAELGLETDLDPAFRLRRESELATIGSATVKAITANILQAFGSKIQTLVVFENDDDTVDTNGLLGHSIEVLIFDGDVPAVDNDAMAQIIFDSKAAGIHTSGNVSGNASALVSGVQTTKAVLFSRAAQMPIYLAISLIKKPGQPYLGDVGVAEQVVTLANAYFGPGDYAITDRIEAFVMSCAGVKDLISVFIGLSASPSGSANIPMTIRQIARFSTSNVVVTSV